jgi:hypothetical protein
MAVVADGQSALAPVTPHRGQHTADLVEQRT